MGSPDPNKAGLVSGKLAYGCTDLALAWPHGGTGLGLVGNIEFRPPAGQVYLPAEEDNRTRAVVYTGGDAVLGASLEDWDDDALAVFFSTTLSDGKRILSWPGSRAAGDVASTITNLVFTPTNEAEHPGLILYAPTPLIEETARLQLSSYRWLSVPVLFLGTPDGSGNVAKMGVFAELTL